MGFEKKFVFLLIFSIFLISFISSAEINDFKYDLTEKGEGVVVVAKLPNFYKQSTYWEGRLDKYVICYKDQWDAFYDSSTNKIKITKHNKISDFFKRLFGNGFCKTTIEEKLKDIEQNPWRIEYQSIVTNSGVSEDEFELIIPEGAEICETNPELIANLTDEINQIEESLFLVQGLSGEERVDKQTKAMRNLTGEEFLRMKDLKIQLAAAGCESVDISDRVVSCNYGQYLGEVFPECANLSLNVQETQPGQSSIVCVDPTKCKPRSFERDCLKILVEEGKAKLSLDNEDTINACKDKTITECWNFLHSDEAFEDEKTYGYSVGPALGYEKEWACYRTPA